MPSLRKTVEVLFKPGMGKLFVGKDASLGYKLSKGCFF